MGIIKLTKPEELLEIQYFLKTVQGSDNFFLNQKIYHRTYGTGVICPVNRFDRVLYARFENGYGEKPIGLHSWQNGYITSLEIDQESFQRIKYTNIILGHCSIEEAVWYLTTVVDQGLAHQLKDIDIKLIFENNPGLEELISERVLDAIEREKLWDSIPKGSRFNLLIQDLKQSPPEDIHDLLSQLRHILKDLPSLAYWNKVPYQYLVHPELWPYLPLDIRVECLFKKTLRNVRNEEEFREFAEHLKCSRYQHYQNKLPDDILIEPIMFSSLIPDKQFELFLSRLSHILEFEERTSVICRLVDFLTVPGRAKYWDRISKNLITEQQIWAIAPARLRVPILIQKITSASSPDEQRHFRVDLAVVMSMPEAWLLWEKIPTKLFTEPELFTVLPAHLKVPLLVNLILPLLGSKEGEERVHALAEILSQAEDLRHWVSTIPEPILLEPKIWSLLPVEKKVPVLLTKIEAQPFESDARRRLIVELAGMMKLSQTQSLWQTIPPALYTEPDLYAILHPNLKVPLLVNIIQPMSESGPRASKVQELAAVLSHSVNSSLWRFLPDELILEPPLIEIAPFEIRLRLFKTIAGKLLTQELKSSFGDIGLSDDDLCLAVKWSKFSMANNEQTADQIRGILERGLTQEQLDDLSRVLSARAAELAVYQFLDQMGYKPEDISLLQKTNLSDTRWKLCDIQCGKLAIDVKNARASQHSKKIYVDQCVPRFKQTRDHQGYQEVRIAGVFSQLLSPAEILYPQGYKLAGNRDVQVLGFTSYSKLEELKKRYELRDKFELYFYRNHLNKESFLPAWVYDYPAAAYTKRAEAIAKLQNIKKPIYDLAQAANVSPLPFVFLLKNPPIDDLKIPGWQMSFARKFCSLPLGDRLSLPHIYLTVLTHFVLMATGEQQETSGYEPIQYRQILFPRPGDALNPLFVVDPLQTVNDLIETLQLLWTNQHEFIRNFKIFRLSQLNVLRGKTDKKENWKTLLAYCGNSNCRHAPLIFGLHKTCECGKLRCPDCDYCDEKCGYYQERRSSPPDIDDLVDQGEIFQHTALVPEEPEYLPADDWSFYLPANDRDIFY